eukprot:4955167-Prymnesium_polylepis.1
MLAPREGRMPVQDVLLCPLGRGGARDHLGRVGRVDARPADVAGGRVRVDRGHSPLGNPFVLGSEEDREAACEAYDLLLAEAL